MDFETIILKKEEHIATITLNRPERLNAINVRMAEELAAAFDDVAGDEEVRVLVLAGAGRAFCAGADMREGEGLRGEGGEGLFGGMFPEGIREGLRRGGQIMTRSLQRLNIPTIAMVNGAAVGGGFDLALACDMRVGSENARFRVAFTALGIIPGTGSTWLLPRVVGLPKAAELIFTGDFLDAKEAARIGVLNKLVPVEELERETMELARKIAKGPPIAIKLDKLLLYQGLQMDLETALEIVAACAPIALTSQDHIEGVKAFIEKREAVYKGR